MNKKFNMSEVINLSMLSAEEAQAKYEELRDRAGWTQARVLAHLETSYLRSPCEAELYMWPRAE